MLYLIHIFKAQSEELSKTSKLSWHNQDVVRLKELTFQSDSHFRELERTISKTEEENMLVSFNRVVEEISKREKINPTLFFSKKAQKEFLRLVLKEGLDIACEEITLWRSELIKKDLLNILK